LQFQQKDKEKKQLPNEEYFHKRFDNQVQLATELGRVLGQKKAFEMSWKGKWEFCCARGKQQIKTCRA